MDLKIIDQTILMYLYCIQNARIVNNNQHNQFVELCGEVGDNLDGTGKTIWVIPYLSNDFTSINDVKFSPNFLYYIEKYLSPELDRSELATSLTFLVQNSFVVRKPNYKYTLALTEKGMNFCFNNNLPRLKVNPFPPHN